MRGKKMKQLRQRGGQINVDRTKIQQVFKFVKKLIKYEKYLNNVDIVDRILLWDYSSQCLHQLIQTIETALGEASP